MVYGVIYVKVRGVNWAQFIFITFSSVCLKIININWIFLMELQKVLNLFFLGRGMTCFLFICVYKNVFFCLIFEPAYNINCLMIFEKILSLKVKGGMVSVGGIDVF